MQERLYAGGERVGLGPVFFLFFFARSLSFGQGSGGWKEGGA